MIVSSQIKNRISTDVRESRWISSLADWDQFYDWTWRLGSGFSNPTLQNREDDWLNSRKDFRRNYDFFATKRIFAVGVSLYSAGFTGAPIRIRTWDLLNRDRRSAISTTFYTTPHHWWILPSSSFACCSLLSSQSQLLEQSAPKLRPELEQAHPLIAQRFVALYQSLWRVISDCYPIVQSK